jgi:hypothetical protein
MQSLWMLVAALLCALMGVCVKFAARDCGVMELVFYRGLSAASASRSSRACVEETIEPDVDK